MALQTPAAAPNWAKVARRLRSDGQRLGVNFDLSLRRRLPLLPDPLILFLLRSHLRVFRRTVRGLAGHSPLHAGVGDPFGRLARDGALLEEVLRRKSISSSVYQVQEAIAIAERIAQNAILAAERLDPAAS